MCQLLKDAVAEHDEEDGQSPGFYRRAEQAQDNLDGFADDYGGELGLLGANQAYQQRKPTLQPPKTSNV
jgi:hypothetical protein